MITATATAVLPTLVIDPTDYLVVDIATGRHLPGDTIHAQQLAHEHGITEADALDALENAWLLGLISRTASSSSGLVVWSPEASQTHLHRLARAMVAVVRTPNRNAQTEATVIDGEQARDSAVELYGLETPCDVELFLELARALLGRSAGHLLDDLAVPVAVLFSVASQRVHGIEFAAPEAERQEIVCGLVHSLMDGRVDDFADLVADYVLALSIH